jgi:CrcB protein
MLNSLLVGLGGALGSVARYWMSFAVTRWCGDAMPWGTIVVNITGCFIIGLFSAATTAKGVMPASHNMREFFMVGICGGYTTFSAFSLQTLTLADQGQWTRAAMNVVLSVVVCLIAVWLGHILAMQMNSTKPS